VVIRNSSNQLSEKMYLYLVDIGQLNIIWWLEINLFS